MHAVAATPPMIVVGVDGSEASKRALRWAADQAKLIGAELKVVTTWEYPPTLGWAPPYPSDFDPDADARKALSATVAEVLGADPGLVMHLTVVEGHPAYVLTETAADPSSIPAKAPWPRLPTTRSWASAAVSVRT